MVVVVAGGADLRENHLRLFVRSAAVESGDALVRLGASSGNPLDSLAEVICDAWTGASSSRTGFLEDVRGIGSRVRGAFDRTRDDLDGCWARDQVMIDVAAHPDLVWKTTDRGVQARSGIHAPRGR
jgi:hypothetical protein